MTSACATCGAPLPADANYCPKCGRLVATSATTAPKSAFPRWLLVVIIVGALALFSIPFLAIFAAILIPNFIHARAESEMAADKANLKGIATALEMYAVDHGGKYPDALPKLVPQYIKTLPMVPGGDGTGAYDYHLNAGKSARTAEYEIWDDGTMDPTVFSGIPRVGGPPCESDCKYVVYRAGVGIIGVPGTTSGNTGSRSSPNNQ